MARIVVAQTPQEHSEAIQNSPDQQQAIADAVDAGYEVTVGQGLTNDGHLVEQVTVRDPASNGSSSYIYTDGPDIPDSSDIVVGEVVRYDETRQGDGYSEPVPEPVGSVRDGQFTPADPKFDGSPIEPSDSPDSPDVDAPSDIPDVESDQPAAEGYPPLTPEEEQEFKDLERQQQEEGFDPEAELPESDLPDDEQSPESSGENEPDEGDLDEEKDPEESCEGCIDGPTGIWDYVPVVGPLWQAASDFSRGNVGWGMFNLGMAAIDAVGVGAIARALGKGAIKLGGKLILAELGAIAGGAIGAAGGSRAGGWLADQLGFDKNTGRLIGGLVGGVVGGILGTKPTQNIDDGLGGSRPRDPQSPKDPETPRDPDRPQDSDGPRDPEPPKDGNESAGPTKRPREEELSIDPQTGRPNPKSIAEAKGILQAEKDGLVNGARRPNLAAREPNYDFKVDGPEPYKWADVKTPVNRGDLVQQAKNIGEKSVLQKGNSTDVLHVIDLTNIPAAEREAFKQNVLEGARNVPQYGSTDGIVFVTS